MKFSPAMFLAAAAMLAPVATDAAPPAAAVPVADLKRALDASVPAMLKQHDVPSAAIAFIADGKLAWTVAYGEQSPGVAATPETLYNVASLTKPITAQVILRLASDGKIDLDKSMSSHWIDPDIADNPWHNLLTPRIALTHRTGFTNWRYETDGKLTFKNKPGTKAGYSGEGYDYLGRFAERRTGRPFEELARELVFDPIAMPSTSFTGKPWFAGRVAMVQGEDRTRKLPDVSERWNGADNVHTTAGDYGRFVLAVMEGRGLKPELAASRWRYEENLAASDCPPELTAAKLCPRSVGNGLGWQVFDAGDEMIVMHTGSDWGEETLAFFVPQRRLGIVVLTSGKNGEKVMRDVVVQLYANRHFNAILAYMAR